MTIGILHHGADVATMREVTAHDAATGGREALKAKLKELDARDAKRRQIEKVAEKLQAELDGLIAGHAEQVAPMRAELDQIAAAQVAEMLEGLDEDSEQEQRRQAISNELASIDAEHDAAKSDLQRRIGLLHAEANSPELSTLARGAVQNELRRTAPEPMLLRMEVLNRTLRWNQARRKEAEAMIAKDKHFLQLTQRQKMQRDIAVAEHRVRSWEADAAQAWKNIRDAQQEQDKLLQDMLTV